MSITNNHNETVVSGLASGSIRPTRGGIMRRRLTIGAVASLASFVAMVAPALAGVATSP